MSVSTMANQQDGSPHESNHEYGIDPGGIPTSIDGPLFILAAPRSFSSVVTAMLGQHPQMYGLPEMHLFGAETMIERRAFIARASFNMNAGLLRAVAELCYCAQTDETIEMARGWLRRRGHFSTGFLLEILAEKVHPQIVVEKSPSTVRRIAYLERAYGMFPRARFLHLVRHPRGQGASVLAYLERLSQVRPEIKRWLNTFDPQKSWHALNMNICRFLEAVPDMQKMRVRGEDLVSNPDPWLREVASWMGLRTDAQAIDEMKHPEGSPYAHPGPAGARAGFDPSMLENPTLRPAKGKTHSLDGPLSWQADGSAFLPRVKHLAIQFGYQ
jgi:hypothetical protein